jgi:hypothetical protein
MNVSKDANVRICFVKLSAPLVDACDVARVTIDMLPDVALLEIFHFYLGGVHDEPIEVWQMLVHVCRKWRNVVFESPRRLNLRLCITARTTVRATMDIWPLLPIVLYIYTGEMRDESDDWDEDNIIAALEHNDRICEIRFFEFPASQSKKVLTAMQQPFPELTHLYIDFVGEAPLQPLADSFLGGSAPRLQTLILLWIPFPGLPKLLLSATHLVHLELWEIPPSGYFSPEAIVNALSVLTGLESLVIGFESPGSRPNRCPLPQTRTLLLILTRLIFNGDDDYLEDLVARIDAPLLEDLRIAFFHQLIFDTAQLTQFISRTPKFNGHDKAHVEINDWNVSVTLPQAIDGRLSLGITCTGRDPDLQLSSLAQVCGSLFPQALIHAVEHLYIDRSRSLSHWEQNIVESRQWLDLLRPFSTVKCLYISWQFATRIAPALQELVRDRATEVLPTLQMLF